MPPLPNLRRIDRAPVAPSRVLIESLMASNPYSSPTPDGSGRGYSRRFGNSVAWALIVFPSVLLVPYCYWIYCDGEWLVSRKHTEPLDRVLMMILLTGITFASLQAVTVAGALFTLRLTRETNRPHALVVCIAFAVAMVGLIWIVVMITGFIHIRIINNIS